MFLSSACFHEDGTIPYSGQIFVFGSNLAGRHGKGAAAIAVKQFGATYGVGLGFRGQSFAIPTKDHALKSLPLADIAYSVSLFCQFTVEHPELRFFITSLGCGLAGYTPKDIAPMFSDCHVNCSFPHTWYGLV